MRTLVIYGAGQLGRQYLHHLRHHCAHEARVAGFVDDTRAPGEPVEGGLLTLGGLDAVTHSLAHGPAQAELVFAIGYNDMRARRAALERTRSAGYALYGFVHPRAMVEPGVQVGAGTFVLAGAVLDQQVEVGAACFIDIGVRLGAGTRVGEGTFLCSGTSTGSRVVVGDDAFVGMDVTIVTDVQVGHRVFVNAKSLVARDLGDDTRLVEVHKAREIPLAR